MAELVPFNPQMPNAVGLIQLQERKQLMQQEQQARDIQLQSAQAARSQTANKRAYELLGRVTDNQSLGMAVQMHIKEFPEMAQETINTVQQVFPQGFNKTNLDKLQGLLVSQQQKFENAAQTRGLDQGEQKIGVSQGNLAVSQGRLAHDKRKLDHEIANPRAGTSFTANPDGSVSFSQGGPANLTKATQNKAQGKMLDASAALARLSEIENDFNRDYLTAMGKYDFAKLTILQKISPGSLSQEDKDYIRQGEAFFSSAYHNINKTMNELSGAAVSPKEEERLRAELPDPGKKGVLNIMSGDSITEYETKLSKAVKRQRMALARLHYISNHGVTLGMEVVKNQDGKSVAFLDQNGNRLALDSMPDFMNKRAQEIGNKIMIQNPDMPKEQVLAEVKRQVSYEFGLVN